MAPRNRTNSSAFDVPTRLYLIESDLDEHDRTLFDFDAKLEGIKKLLVGLVVSFATATVVFALNLIVVQSQ